MSYALVCSSLFPGACRAQPRRILGQARRLRWNQKCSDPVGELRGSRYFGACSAALATRAGVLGQGDVDWAGNIHSVGFSELGVVEFLGWSSGRSCVVPDNAGCGEFCCNELYRSFYVHFAVGREAGDEDRCAYTVGVRCGRRWIMVGGAFRLKQ